MYSTATCTFPCRLLYVWLLCLCLCLQGKLHVKCWEAFSASGTVHHYCGGLLSYKCYPSVWNCIISPFHSQDLISNLPYCVPYNFMMLVLRIYIGLFNIPLIDIFLSSHHFSAWYCTDIIRRNSVFVSYGSWTFKFPKFYLKASP